MSAGPDCAALAECLHRARAELACPTCHNNPRGQLKALGWDECAECHGEHRNRSTIELLEQLAIRVDQLERIVCP